MRFCKVVIEPSAYILWAFLLLALPLDWFVAYLLAVLIHELLHVAAILFMKKKPESIRIGFQGAELDVMDLSDRQELLCALAGPCAGFLLLVVRRWYPELSVVAMAQSLYNLIPIYPLDGGRVIRCMAAITGIRHADRLCLAIEVITYMVILGCLIMCAELPVIIIGCLMIGKVGLSKNTLQTDAYQGTIELPIIKR